MEPQQSRARSSMAKLQIQTTHGSVGAISRGSYVSMKKSAKSPMAGGKGSRSNSVFEEDQVDIIRTIWKQHESQMLHLKANFHRINVCQNEYEFDPEKDKIFKLAQRYQHKQEKTQNIEDFADEIQDHGLGNQCRICATEYKSIKELKSRQKDCHFCGNPCCDQCMHSLRRFPSAIVLAKDAKDDPIRGDCCKICVVKFFIRDKYVESFENPDDGIKSKDVQIKKRHEDLKLRLEELVHIKKNIMQLRSDLNTEEERFLKEEQRLQDDYEQKLNAYEVQKSQEIQKVSERTKKLQTLKEQCESLTDKNDELEREIPKHKEQLENKRNQYKCLLKLKNDYEKKMRLENKKFQMNQQDRVQLPEDPEKLKELDRIKQKTLEEIKQREYEQEMKKYIDQGGLDSMRNNNKSSLETYNADNHESSSILTSMEQATVEATDTENKGKQKKKKRQKKEIKNEQTQHASAGCCSGKEACSLF